MSYVAIFTDDERIEAANFISETFDCTGETLHELLTVEAPFVIIESYRTYCIVPITDLNRKTIISSNDVTLTVCRNKQQIVGKLKSSQSCPEKEDIIKLFDEDLVPIFVEDEGYEHLAKFVFVPVEEFDEIELDDYDYVVVT